MPQKLYHLKIIYTFSLGSPSISKSDGDLAPGQIAAVTFPTSIFADPQVAQGPVTVAVTVYEEPVFFPVPENDINNTVVGTPVVSLMVASNGKQLQFDNLDPPIELNLAITQIDPRVKYD